MFYKEDEVESTNQEMRKVYLSELLESGLVCPSCQSRDGFAIDVRATLTVSGSLENVTTSTSTEAPTALDICRCGSCSIQGTLHHFLPKAK